MTRKVFKPIFFKLLLLSVVTGFELNSAPAYAQFSESTQKENGLLQHGIEQYEQQHYSLAETTLSEYLKSYEPPLSGMVSQTTNADGTYQKALYYLALSKIQNGNSAEIKAVAGDLLNVINPYYKSQEAWHLGHYYFRQEDLQQAIKFYNLADITHLNNDQIGDKKFELAYCYFNNNQLDQAMPLFKAIKDLPDNKYYIPGNYYYGLLAYNNQNYPEALKSFKRIDQSEGYSDVVPYYEAEISYFQGNTDQTLTIAKAYLGRGNLYYTKEMELLAAQALFEKKDFKAALPYFESYYNQSDKIRKEVLYEMAYTYYRLEDWNKAIDRFQPLSNANDSLGQTSMYLLGDCYLRIGDKKGARNAFSLCSNMDYNPSQKEAALFLYGKLSDELGFESIAIQSLNKFVQTYPQSNFSPEARVLLSRLFMKGNNYTEAFHILSQLPVKDNETWGIYQKVAVGSGLQELQANHLNIADSLLSLSLQQPNDPAYEAVAYFWKGEINYRLEDYQNAIQFNNNFLNLQAKNANAIKRISPSATVGNAKLTIGAAQMKIGDYNQAQQSFASIKNLKSDDPQDMQAALLNEADAYFMQKDFKNAETDYQKILNSSSDQKDYAQFQLALIRGINGDFSAKETMLQSLIDNHPNGNYRLKAEYELAMTQIQEGENDKAISGLNTLIRNSKTSDNLKGQAMVKLGYAYQTNNQPQEAINTYKAYLTQFPADSGRNAAIEALRVIYIGQGQPAEFVTFLKDNHLPLPQDSVLEKTYYDAAIMDFSQDKWQDAAQGFGKYLAQFPKGGNSVKAHFYKGIAEDKSNSPDSALKDFSAVLASGWSDFAVDAAKYGSSISLSKKDFGAAQIYFRQLRNLATDPADLQTAYSGLMKTAYELDSQKMTINMADTLLTLPKLLKNDRVEAMLYKARSLQTLGQIDSANALYRQIDTQNLGAFSAEARYRIAEISYNKGLLEQAEKEAGYAVQTSAGQDYWIVKCYLLLGDILTQEKDYFNAKATFSSIIKNTKIAEFKTLAQQKLNQVIALEKTNSKKEIK